MKKVKKENKKSKKEKYELQDKIEDFIYNYNISAILHVEGLGTFSIFKDDGAKLRVLEEARIELDHRKKLVKEEVESRLNSENNFLRSMHIETPKYIG